MTVAAVAIGSNLGDRIANLRFAVGELSSLGTIVALSSVYETAPIGGPEQGPYLNAVATIETDLEPHALLDALLAIESEAGRLRTIRWGPRTLDLDVILYGREEVDDERLTVPHPRFAERRFVLEPLLEVMPDAVAPDGGEVASLLPAVSGQELTKTRLRLRERRDSFGSKGGWWVAVQGVVLVASLVALLVDARSLPWPAWTVWLGAILAVAGAVQSFLGLQHLGVNLTPYPEPLSSARLVALGVYRLVRHPIYGGIVEMLVGAALFRRSLVALLIGVVGAVFFWSKAYFEERRLMEHYPGYATYRSRVTRRLIPWVV